MKAAKHLFIALIAAASLSLGACESLKGFGSSDQGGQGGVRGGGLFRF